MYPVTLNLILFRLSIAFLWAWPNLTWPPAGTGHSLAIQEKPEENAEGGDDAGGGARLPMVGKRGINREILYGSYMCHGAKIMKHRLCTDIRGMAINPLIGILLYTIRIPIVGWMTISDLLLTAYVGKDGKILPNYVLIRFFKAMERLWSNTYHIFRGWTSVNLGLLKLARIYHLVMTNIAMKKSQK